MRSRRSARSCRRQFVGVGVAAAYVVLMRRERDTSQAIRERIAAISAIAG